MWFETVAVTSTAEAGAFLFPDLELDAVLLTEMVRIYFDLGDDGQVCICSRMRLLCP